MWKTPEPYVVYIVNWQLLPNISRTVVANSFSPMKQNKGYKHMLLHINYLLNIVNLVHK